MSFEINGNVFSLSSGGSIFVDNDFGFSDALQFTILFQNAFGYDLLNIRFNLQDTSGLLFSDTSLPTELFLEDFDNATFTLTGNTPGTASNLKDLRFDGTLTAFAASIPIPAVVCTGFLPPFDKVLSFKKKVKRAIPVDMVLTDADGYTVTDADIAAPPVINVLFNSQVYGEVPPDTDDLLPLGSANDDNQFRFDPDSGQWVYNLGTKQFTAEGTYTVIVASGDSNEYTIDPMGGQCTQTFERLS